MPYRTNDNLPPRIQRDLPSHAQTIFRETFNHAYATYRGEARREEFATRAAWAAVKKSYEKIGETWKPRAKPRIVHS